MPTNHLLEIEALGTAIWLDDISRGLIEDGRLLHFVQDDGLSGVTSNPTIFERAIAGSRHYDGALAAAVADGLAPRDIFFRLALQDVRDACDVLRPTFERSNGLDGFVSFELPPDLARDVEGSIEAARRFGAEIARPNALVKVPGTPEGVQAFEELTAAGVSINVTLLFALGRYEEVANAYLRGLERRLEGGQPVGNVSSVASFFVSRVDARVDAALAERGRPDLCGRAAIANAKLAYQAFLRIFSGPRWEALTAHGAQLQRPLWASTSTKNPAYPDTLYVENLIGPHTVNTMPEQTLAAARDHALARRTVDENAPEARRVLEEIRGCGIDLDDLCSRVLVEEGVDAFVRSFDAVVATIAARTSVLRRVGKVSSAGIHVQREGLERLRRTDAVRRLFARDSSLWPGGQGARWLGWLDAVDEQRATVDDLHAWAREATVGLDHVVVCGMGGSSLAPLVFGALSGAAGLHVLDSTDPHAVRSMPTSRALYVISSKSGTTLETACFAEHFWHATRGDGRRFVAITDPGTPLEARATRDGWRAIFRGRPDVGGRYSALTPFGLVPASLAGAPVGALLDDARAMLAACGPAAPLELNPAALLGSLLGRSALDGRDKLTIVASPGLESVGLWLEQLVAESTGKRGAGIVPVAGEPLGLPEVYAADRSFVYLRRDDTYDAALARLEQHGHVVVTFPLARLESLGGELLRWEVAVALAGAILEIDPFDQPDVQAAKDLTAELLASYEQERSLPAVDPGTLRDVVAPLRRGRSYLCLQAFVEPSPEHDALLGRLQGRLRDALGVAVTAGFGPRYLHSTGQLHKGGPRVGAFIQLLACDGEQDELWIPGRAFGFRTLRDAQALADARALRERGLPVARIPVDEAESALDAALGREREAV